MSDENTEINPEEDVEIVEENNETQSSFKSPDTKKLKEKLKVCMAERQEYLDGWQRAQADLINAGKEHEKSRKDSIKFASENILMELLPVIDSFEMAFANKEAWESVDANWRTGVEYIHSQMMKIFEDNGMKTVAPAGERFNPSLHESVDMVEVDTKDNDGMIMEVVQAGYEINGKMMRPARVKVGIFK